MRKRLTMVFFLVAALFSASSAFCADSSAVPRMTKEDLKTSMESPDVTIVDVRTKADWDMSEWKIKGAIREDPQKVKSWEGQIPKDRTIVLYCA